MACTAIKIGDVRMRFITTPVLLPHKETNEEKLFTRIELYSCDEDFIPTGTASVSIHELDEETYHKQLRAQASEKDHFIAGESTDVEWNPNYKPEEHGDESALSCGMPEQQK